MGKGRRSKAGVPEERSSSRWVVPLREDSPDPKASDPERLLMAAEEGALEDGEEGGALGSWEDMEPLVARLHPSDQDILALYYRDGMRQRQIGLVMGMTQGGVSYRLRKARRRIEFLRTVPAVRREDLDRDLAFLSPASRELVWSVYVTTSQTETARRLNEAGVRHPLGRVWTQSTVAAAVRGALRAMRARREGSSLKEALLGTEWGLRAPFGSGASRSSPEGAEALRRAKEELEAHLESLARLDPYIEFIESLFRDKRWGILHLTQFCWNPEVRARKMAEAGVSFLDDGPDDP